MPWHTTHASLLSRLHDVLDHGAWREFDAQYGELLVRYSMSRGLQYSDAEDVRQTVMLNLSRALPKFQYSAQRGRFRSYLGQVVRHTIANLHRQNCPVASQATLDSVAPASLDAAQLDEDWEREWVQHHYRRAMLSIRATQDPRSVEAFEMLVAGQSVKDVAVAVRFTEAAVNKVKQRMRDRIKAIIEEQIQRENEGIDGT